MNTGNILKPYNFVQLQMNKVDATEKQSGTEWFGLNFKVYFYSLKYITDTYYPASDI